MIITMVRKWNGKDVAEEIATDREGLVKDLNWTAGADYRASVLEWFDAGHRFDFSIVNGDGTDVWSVSE